MKKLFTLILFLPLIAFSQQSSPDVSAMKIEIVQLPRRDVLTIRETCTMATIGATLGKLYGEMGKYMADHELHMTGPVFAIYHSSAPQKLF
ncbi:MAG: hypothetical protein ABIO46_00565 [Chitinophagales bacterium]